MLQTLGVRSRIPILLSFDPTTPRKNMNIEGFNQRYWCFYHLTPHKNIEHGGFLIKDIDASIILPPHKNKTFFSHVISCRGVYESDWVGFEVFFNPSRPWLGWEISNLTRSLGSFENHVYIGSANGAILSCLIKN